jgi:hypothetical protein
MDRIAASAKATPENPERPPDHTLQNWYPALVYFRAATWPIFSRPLTHLPPRTQKAVA